MSSRKRPRPSPREERVVSRLRELEDERAPFRELMRRLVHAAFERFPVPASGPIVEIGAGLGELYSLLPDSVRARWVLTEPTELGVRQLRQRFPALRVERAAVDHLPFGDGEVAAVVGLCVLDLVPELALAREEVERVLMTGGILLHFLDQNPHLARIFDQLAPLGLIVLPNVFDDPSRSHFPDDLCAMPGALLAELAGVLRAHGHALGAPLARYIELFTEQPWQPERALTEFDHLASANDRRTLLRSAFDAAGRLASPEEQERLGDLRGHLISSSRDLSGRFERELTSSALSSLYNNISSVCELIPARMGQGYCSSCVGQHRALTTAPHATLVPAAPRPAVGQQLRELGVHIFAAKRQ